MKTYATKEELFEEIMKDTYVKSVLHYDFVMKSIMDDEFRSYVGDIDKENWTMYFSYSNVWSKFEKHFNMTYDEIFDFLKISILAKLGILIKPY